MNVAPGRRGHPGGRRAVRRAVAEHRLRDDGRPHRLPGAGPHPGPRERRRRAGPVGRHLAAAGLGQPRTTGRASSTRPPCRARSTRSRGSSSRPTRPSPRPVWARSSPTTGTTATARSGSATLLDGRRRGRQGRRRGHGPRSRSDQHSPYADVLVPVLLSLDIERHVLRRRAGAAAHVGPRAVGGLGRRRRTSRRSGRTSSRSAFADDLPDGHGPAGGSRWLEVVRRLLDEPASPWWDDKSTAGVVEGRDEVLTRAMVAARRELTAAAGPRRRRTGAGDSCTRPRPSTRCSAGRRCPGLIRNLVNPDPVAGRWRVLDRGRHRLGRQLRARSR